MSLKELQKVLVVAETAAFRNRLHRLQGIQQSAFDQFHSHPVNVTFQANSKFFVEQPVQIVRIIAEMFRHFGGAERTVRMMSDPGCDLISKAVTDIFLPLRLQFHQHQSGQIITGKGISLRRVTEMQRLPQ